MIKAILISGGLALLTLIPYIFAYAQVQPEGVFSGFLLNPIDGFSYLAKMRQGLEGNWLFVLPYTAEPGEGAFIFVYFLFLGQLAYWTGIQTIHVYHIARVVSAALMFIAAFKLLSYLIHSKRLRWGAFSIILLGAGFGWLGIPFDILASDLWIVESIPFQTAYANAHFPLATALFLGLIVLIVSDRNAVWMRMIGTFLFSTLLAAVQPFSIFALFVFLFLWIVWETWIEVSKTKVFKWKSELGEKWLIYIVMVASAMPWLIYDFWLTIAHSQIAAWNIQNKTPSPPLIEFILGFGAPLMLAIVGVIKGNFKEKKTDRLLLVWFVVQSLMIYAPFGLQRRVSLGLYFALVPVALLTLERIIRNPKLIRFAIMVLLILSIPSNLIIVGSGLFGVGMKDPAVVLGADENEAYQWLSLNSKSSSLILAGPIAGNRIPAFTNLKVIYGHPFETINAEKQKTFVETAYSSNASAEEGLNQVMGLGVRYVFYGPEEKNFGEPVWLDGQNLVFSVGEYDIYEISYP